MIFTHLAATVLALSSSVSAIKLDDKALEKVYSVMKQRDINK